MTLPPTPSPILSNRAAPPAARACWNQLLDHVADRYRPAGRFASHFARGKLGMDPVFRHLLAEGLLPAGAEVVDIGCGQGLLTGLLRAVDAVEARLGWPADWAAAPLGCRVTGVELMARDVERARAAAAAAARGGASRDEFICGDMRLVPVPPCDAVVILDVLHYIPVDEQDAVLARVHAALRPGGRLLLRVGDAQERWGFRVSQWVDRVVTLVRGHSAPPTWGRSLADWQEALRRLGFTVEARPMSQGTPFANVLLIGRRRDGSPPPVANPETS